MHGGIKLQLYIAKDLKESRITCLKTVCYLQYGDDDDGVDNADGDDQDYGDDDDVDDQVGGGFDDETIMTTFATFLQIVCCPPQGLSSQ